MKILKYFFILFLLQSQAQELKIVSFEELNYEVNRDSTLFVVKKNDKLLNGKYKIIMNSEEYAISEFKDGKISGIVESYYKDVLNGTTEYKDGLKNGYEISYRGKQIMWKIGYVNGVRHGHTWWGDKGDEYYINDVKSTKSEFEEYERKNIKK